MQNYNPRSCKLVESRLFTKDGKRYLYLKYENTLPNGDIAGATAEVDLEMGIEGYLNHCYENYRFDVAPKCLTASGISFNKSTWEMFYKEAPTKEMTLKDVESKLGYKIKIVSE